MTKDKMTIGILGGMGTYATINLFQQYAKTFPAEKEWERPRIVIDNRCTMPSRVRAFIYGENKELLVNQMSDSISHLMDMGCNKIILACNTSHLFLPDIYRRISGLESILINIIDSCVNAVVKDNVQQVLLLGSEGTIDSQIYQRKLWEKNIICIVPDSTQYSQIRECIEAVKRNEYSQRVKEIFLNLVKDSNACILGCTELPVLYDMYRDEVECKKIYDPILISLEMLRKEYENE